MAEDEKPTVKLEVELPAETAKQVVAPLITGFKPQDESDESMVKKATGYEVGEIVAAPLKPTEPSVQSPVRGQVHNLVVGFAIVALSLFVWPILGFNLFVAVALIGAIFIALGTLVRV